MSWERLKEKGLGHLDPVVFCDRMTVMPSSETGAGSADLATVRLPHHIITHQGLVMAPCLPRARGTAVVIGLLCDVRKTAKASRGFNTNSILLLGERFSLHTPWNQVLRPRGDNLES